MKIFTIENNDINQAANQSTPVFSLRPETSLLRNNQSFFYPEFSKKIVCSVSVVIRLSRIGRCIYEKFANRYYEEVGVGVCFTAIDVLQNMQLQNMPTDCARAFDFSTPVSPVFIGAHDCDINNIDCSLKINNAEVQRANTAQMRFGIDKIVSHISQFVSFKIGDLIFVNPATPALPINIGDNLQAFINDKKLLDFVIE